jgi:hypothetical protein
MPSEVSKFCSLRMKEGRVSHSVLCMGHTQIASIRNEEVSQLIGLAISLICLVFAASQGKRTFSAVIRSINLKIAIFANRSSRGTNQFTTLIKPC